MVKGNKNRNAFYYFMLDFQKQQGRSFKSMNNVATEAGPHWQKMTAQQKKKYEDIAKQYRENQQKQTTIGENIDVVEREEKEKRDREISMKTDIENLVRRLVNTNTIADQYFYLMHINEFCYWEKECRYYPAEIAIGKFNLRDGIDSDDVYHTFVHPGPLPLGYSAIAKVKAEETHQIQHMGTDNNMEEVLTEIIKKLSENTDSDKLPPIFVSEKDILLIENVLGYMCNDYEQNNVFTLYSLQYLLHCIKNSVAPKGPTGGNAWPTVSVSKLQLEKDVYDFCVGIACNYHEQSETPVYCSRSRIIRWAYIVCDNCVTDLNLPIIPGKHVPKNSLTNCDMLGEASGISVKNKPISYAPSTSYESSKYETDMASEANTIVDDSASSYHGFDSDSQVADDEDDWKRPRRTVKHKHHGHSQQSDCASQLSQSSSAGYIPNRKPITQSGVGLGRSQVMVGRGRGRGIIQTRPPI